MGRIKLCGVMLAVIVASNVYGYFFIERRTGEIMELLDHTEALADEGKREAAMEQALILERKWKNYMDTAGIFLRDEKMSGINSSISRLYPMIEENCEELGSEFAGARSGLEWILDSETPKYSNIL